MRIARPQATMLLILAAVGLSNGCGVIRHHEQAARLRLDGSVSRTYPEEVNRVAIALVGSLKPEVAMGDFDFSIGNGTQVSVDPTYKPPADAPHQPIPGEFIKVEGLVFDSAELTGTTADGREVKIAILTRRFAEGTSVVVQVGKSGDDKLSRVLLDRIADRLAHPEHAPGSPGEKKELEDLLGLRGASVEMPPILDTAKPRPIP